MNKVIFTVLFFIYTNVLFAQWIFQHGYGDNRNERCQLAFECSDGGLLLNCATTSYGTGDVDGLIVKTDAQGNILWSKSCGHASNDVPTFAAETFDNKIIFTGTTDSSGSHDIFLYKTDSAGNVLWTKLYGGQNFETATKIIEMNDHGYAIVGMTESFGSGLGDIYLIRTDANGDTLFTRMYGTTDSESGKSMSVTSDGGFIIAGKSTATIGGSVVIQAILVRTDSSGNLLWAKLYGDSLFQEAQSVLETADGGFIVCGSRDYTPNGNYDILLFKTDSVGTIQWSKTYGGNKGEGSYSVHITEDGSYVLSGYTNSMGVGHSLRIPNQSVPVASEHLRRPIGGTNYMLGDDSTNIFLMKTDALGDTIWTRTYGDSLQEEAFLSTMTSDNGFMLSGFSDYHNSDSSQAFIIKTDENGYSGCYSRTAHPIIVTDLMVEFSPNYIQTSGMTPGYFSLASISRNVNDSVYCLLTGIQNMSEGSSIRIFPNPVNDMLFIEFEFLEYTPNPIQVNIYDMLGKKVIATLNSLDEKNSTVMDVSNLPRGYYVIKVTYGKERFVSRFIRD